MAPQLHQFHTNFSNADAVSQQMTLIQRTLRDAGVTGNIYTVEARGQSATTTLRWDPASPPLMSDRDWILIHHSHGNPHLHSVLSTKANCALVYHNVTPPEFFAHDPYLADLCRLGRDQLKLLQPRIKAAFTVSQYNAEELKAAGFTVNGLLPLIDIKNFPALDAKIKVGAKEKFNFLFIGKLAPHKSQALIVETFAHFVRFCPEAHLTLVGREDPFYGRYVSLLVKRWGLSRQVTLLGPLDIDALREQYQKADAFLCLSQHEGFCVPIIEAMSMKLPIFSSVAAGLQETLGKSGIQLHTRSPETIATTIAATVSDPSWKEKMLSTQAKRMSEVTTSQEPGLITAALLPLLE